MQYIVAVLALVASLASPRGEGPSFFVDTFDGLKAAGALTPEITEPPGTVNGTTYNMWQVNSIPSDLGLAPGSSPNIISTFLSEELTAGNLLNPSTSVLSTKGTMTAAPGTSFFSLDSLYFGCLFPDSDTQLNVPYPCAMNVQGIQTDGNAVQFGPVTFTPTPGTVSPMQEINIGQSLLRLESVTFELVVTTPSTLLEALGGVLFLDNVVKTVYKS